MIAGVGNGHEMASDGSARLGQLKRAGAITLILTPIIAAVSLGLPACPAAALLGIPCPGCGLTRASLATFRGDFGEALAFHPLVWIVLPTLAYTLGVGAFAYVRGGQTRAERSSQNDRRVTWAAAALFVLLVGVWAARFFGLFGGPAPVESFWQHVH